MFVSCPSFHPLASQTYAGVFARKHTYTHTHKHTHTQTCVQDYAKCSWPQQLSGIGDVALAAWMDALNDSLHWGEIERLCNYGSAGKPPGLGSQCVESCQQVTGNCVRASVSATSPTTSPCSSSSSSRCDIITFSHFLPFQGLLPEKRFLTYPNLVGPVWQLYSP